jgi:hypothetical protein
VHEADAHARRFHDLALGQQPPHLGGIDVAVHRREPGPKRAQLLEHGRRGQVAGVQHEVRRPHPLDTFLRDHPGAARQMGVRDDRDLHRGEARRPAR